MMDPKLLTLFKSYYAENEKLMSDFNEDADMATLNKSMAALDDKFVEDYFIHTGTRIDRDKIADTITAGLSEIHSDDDQGNNNNHSK